MFRAGGNNLVRNCVDCPVIHLSKLWWMSVMWDVVIFLKGNY